MTEHDKADNLPDEDLPEVNQPGLSELREAVAKAFAGAKSIQEQLPSARRLRQDTLAALNSAVSSVPDGLASGVLAGVNPIYGLYACMAGPAAGGFFSSTQLMMIVTTSASALAAGQALAGLPAGAERDNALFLMVILIGVFQILFGLLHLGQLTRFVSYSVMTGFLSGIAVLTVLSQLPTITGYAATGGNSVIKTLDLLMHLGQVHWLSLAMAALALVLAVLLPRTPVGSFGTLIAIAVPSLIALLIGFSSVKTVQDVGRISGQMPQVALPSFFDISFNIITGALAIAAIVIVQGAGVSQSVPNPDGSRRRASRDFIGQGVGNIASGLFRGLPVGGSLSTTAVNIVSGGRSRWSVILSGLWMALIVIVFPSVISRVSMPALGGLLIYASARAIKPGEVASIWATGWPSRLAIVTTFLATLFLPIAAAVGIGMVLSALLYINESSTDVSVVELVERPDGKVDEHPRPKELHSNGVTVLDVYGHLFYAGARTLERLLPSPKDAQNPVVILRLRGRQTIGATLIEVLSNYAQKLHDVGGRLYLTGLSQGVLDQVQRIDKLHLSEVIHAYKATPTLGESTQQAYAHATTWLVERVPGDASEQAAQGRVETR